MLPRISSDAKGEQLKKWGDTESDFLRDLSDVDLETDLHTNFLQDNPPPFGLSNLSDDFNTLRLSSESDAKNDLKPAFSRGRSPHVRDTSARATLSPRVFLDYTEKHNDDVSFGEGFEFSEKDQARLKDWVSPATVSLPSPSNRRSLSSYSEDTDTDITEMDDEDFDEIDDIFGKEESGIYKATKKSASTKPGSTKPGSAGRAGDILNQRKQQLQKEAELEDKELYTRYQSQNEVNTLKQKDLLKDKAQTRDDVQTLKLKDFADADHTFNYEYTKDDFESIEDGFLGDPSPNIKADRLSQFRTPTSSLHHKTSMPAFPRSLKTFNPAKSKSTMDLNARMGSPKEHPFFNHNNKLIKKLDRMPSFHTEKDRIQTGRREFQKNERVGIEEENECDDRGRPLSNEDIDYNMELHKKQLLEKYMEITEKQIQLRSSPKKKKVVETADGPRRNIGLVKFLNDQSYAPVVDNRKMRFNASAKTWEGNEHDLLRFEDTMGSPKKQKQPGLITSDQFRQPRTQKGNMRYDAANLRWVNMDPLDEEADNVFHDVSDLVPDDLPQYVRGGHQNRPNMGPRGVSTFTQRTVSMESTNSGKPGAYAGDEFHLSRKAMARFEKEEEKIRKKTHNWFGADETYHLSTSPFDSDYFWDIRKMVIDDNINDV